jgi:hypothetical protein
MVNPLILPAVVTLVSFIVIHIHLGAAENSGTVSTLLPGWVIRAGCETHCPCWLEEKYGKKPV